MKYKTLVIMFLTLFCSLGISGQQKSNTGKKPQPQYNYIKVKLVADAESDSLKDVLYSQISRELRGLHDVDIVESGRYDFRMMVSVQEADGHTAMSASIVKTTSCTTNDFVGSYLFNWVGSGLDKSSKFLVTNFDVQYLQPFRASRKMGIRKAIRPKKP